MNTPNRQKEIEELDRIEAKRRNDSFEDHMIYFVKKFIDIIRWFLSLMFFIVSFTFFGEEDAMLKMCIGLVIAFFLNPITFRFFKNMFEKEG